MPRGPSKGDRSKLWAMRRGDRKAAGGDRCGCSSLGLPFVTIFVTILFIFSAIAYLLETTAHVNYSDAKLQYKIQHKVDPNLQSNPSFTLSVQPRLEVSALRSSSKEATPLQQVVPGAREKLKPRTIEEALHSSQPRKTDPTKKSKGRDKDARKPARRANKYWTPKVFMKDPDWGSKGELRHIDMIPTPRKIMIKKDRKVIFPNTTIAIPHRNPAEATSPVDATLAQLRGHLLFRQPELAREAVALEEVIYRIKHTIECAHIPVFLTMATVGDILYWQLIENFVYTLAKFELVRCALVVCVSDPICMRMCADSSFPCFDFRSDAYPSTMEKIAMLKLRFLPRALLRGVDMFMLDLDVGFLADPHVILQAFENTPVVDIFVQEDYTFIMNRSAAGWKQWFTEPLPNIGAFLCRGNNRTHRVFEIALEKYLTMDDPVEKSNPGKDQNHVLEAVRIGRGTFGLKYAYLTNNTAPLLDKVILYNTHVFELGGVLMERLWSERQSMLIHTTCYEKSTKVMGLKASNAYWNPFYYNPQRRTLTKQLIYSSDLQILDEVRSLLFLASLTNRALILPNLLGRSRNALYTIKYGGHHLFPAFRVLHIKRADQRLGRMFSSAPQGTPEISPLLEPAFYWRTARDYGPVPQPHVLELQRGESLMDVLRRMQSADAEPRLVLHGSDGPLSESAIASVLAWAEDSVGLFDANFESIRRRYVAMPSIKEVKYSAAHAGSSAQAVATDLLSALRPCKNIFSPPAGNRSCFQICD